MLYKEVTSKIYFMISFIYLVYGSRWLSCSWLLHFFSRKKLKKWKESKCQIHSVLIKGGFCIYYPPWRFLYIPSILRNGDKKRKEQLWRGNKDKTTCKPSNSNRICNSDHCVDGESTVTHPFPELKLGYKNATEKWAS